MFINKGPLKEYKNMETVTLPPKIRDKEMSVRTLQNESFLIFILPTQISGSLKRSQVVVSIYESLRVNSTSLSIYTQFYT